MNNIYNYKLNPPYKGLIPYTESDRLIFFGRDTDRETILRNLITWRLTILYGARGVGKSSILRAGVAHYLHQTAQDNVNLVGKPGWAVIVFPYFPVENKLNQDSKEKLDKKFSWQNPLTGIKEQLKAEMKSLGVEELPPEDISLVETLKEWVKIIGTEEEGGRLFIILDQFEEYFVSLSEFASCSQGDKNKLLRNFAKEFSEAVNDINLNVNFLISIREESLSKIDYFQGQIKSDLLKKRLQLKPLNRNSARKAIEQPIAQYNRQAIILESLQNSRLTFIDGDSDTHKSTLLNGIVQYIENNLDPKEQPKLAFTPSPFNKWDTIDSSPLKFIKQKIEAEEENSKLFLLFDQFEDYLFTQPKKARELLQGLPSLLKEFPNTNFLICFDNSWLSESEKNQWLSEFTSFNNQIADYPKYLHLSNNRGIYDIEEEIVNLNNIKTVKKRFKFKIEPKLIDEVLEGIQRESECFETSAFQLVMTYLWQEETQLKLPPYTLQAETFRNFAKLESDNRKKLKLAVENIVRKHVYEQIKQQKLSEFELEMAISLFNHLITPSGIRLAPTVGDLIHYAKESDTVDESELTKNIRSLLKKLSQGNFPILRTVLGDRYEIFRPVLDKPIRQLVQRHRKIKDLEQEAKEALREFEFSQLKALLTVVQSGKQLTQYVEDNLLFENYLHTSSLRIILQQILSNIQERNEFQVHKREVLSVSFSPDGKSFATASADGTARLWDLQGHKLSVFKGHKKDVRSVSFSPDGKQLASGSWDDKVYLWDLQGNLIGKPLKGSHKNGV